MSRTRTNLHSSVHIVVFLGEKQLSYVSEQVDIHLSLGYVVEHREEIDGVKREETKEREDHENDLGYPLNSEEKS